MGWYIVTRGYWYILPNGQFKKEGKIFKVWSLFWEQYREEKKIYYQHGELEKKYNLLKKIKPAISSKLFVHLNGVCLKMPQKFSENKITDTELSDMSDVLACEIEVSDGEIYLYVNEPVYLFPSWIRYPLSECPPCMASVYGTAIYWFVVTQEKSLFLWASKENLAKWVFWVMFCLILSCLNKFIDKKIN
jgi:hypothetical protein